ncbi:MAG: thioredoxin domain-containing protein [Gemmatimonadaceae bacterium]|nr:thioredoxin domain-containing protein [Gemmatimonadaceae bacterium]
MKQKNLFIGAAAALVVMFAGASMMYTSSKSTTPAAIPQANQAALVRSHAATVGPADAPVTIVEFLDPACETCATFYPMVKDMMAANPGRIRIVYRWAPFHNGSQDVVAMIEAARKQDKLWPALEALLATQAEWSPGHTPQAAAAWKQLEGLGLNREQMIADMASPEIAQLIAQDLADAASLNVTMTPEFFVNGKPLPSFGWEQLKQLVDEALQATQKAP